MNDWIKEAIFYHIYPLGFCGAPLKNEENAPCRRLDKLAEWIGHLKELGVNALYLGPVFESSSHGYDTRDYYQIDRRLGDRQSFAALCDKLHQAGIRIILDGVFNHVGREFAPFVHVREHGADSPYCSWFTNLNFGGPSPLGDPFWYEGWQGHYELVKLNLRHPELVAHLLGAVKQWIELYHIAGCAWTRPIRSTWIFFDSCAGTRMTSLPGSGSWARLSTVITAAGPVLGCSIP